MVELKKDIVDSAGLLGVLLAIVAAIVAWRAPLIVEALFAPVGTGDQITARRRKLSSAIRSLIPIVLILATLDPVLWSAFSRVQTQTEWNFGGLDIVLTMYQLVAGWLILTGIVSAITLIYAVYARLTAR